MEHGNVLDIGNRETFRKWLSENHDTEKECWLCVKKGRPRDDDVFYYIDAVEEAICFGWIDSISEMIAGKRYQRFTPRTKKGNWSELNKERARRLEKLGLMTDAGRETLPDMDVANFKFDKAFIGILKRNGIEEIFYGFHPLYQRVRSTNVVQTKVNDPKGYRKTVKNFVEKTKAGEMYGEWNDYGRLLDY